MALYADALVAIYRFLPIEDSGPVFRICFEPERSEPVKICVIRACLTLVQDAARFPWQKPLDQPASWIATRGHDLPLVRPPFYMFYALLIFSHCSSLVFVISKLIAMGLSDGLRLDQKLNDLCQNLFRKGKFSSLVSFRSGECLLYSFSSPFRLRKMMCKNG